MGHKATISSSHLLTAPACLLVSLIWCVPDPAWGLSWPLQNKRQEPATAGPEVTYAALPLNGSCPLGPGVGGGPKHWGWAKWTGSVTNAEAQVPPWACEWHSGSGAQASVFPEPCSDSDAQAGWRWPSPGQSPT